MKGVRVRAVSTNLAPGAAGFRPGAGQADRGWPGLLVGFMLAVTLLLAVAPLPASAVAGGVFLGPAYGDAVAAQVDFRDIRDHWARQAVRRIAASGIVRGYGDGTFGPENPVTVEQAMVLLVRLAGLEPQAERPNQAAGQGTAAPGGNGPGAGPITGAEAYLAAAVEGALITQAERAGLAARLDQPALRQEVAAWLARALGLDPVVGRDIKAAYAFSDASQFDPKTLPYLEAVLQEGMMVGVGEGRFAPLAPVKRGEAAVLLDRAAGRLAAARHERYVTGAVAGITPEQLGEGAGGLTRTSYQVLTGDGETIYVAGQRGGGLPARDFPVFAGDRVETSAALTPGTRVRLALAEPATVLYAEVLPNATASYQGRLDSLAAGSLTLAGGGGDRVNLPLAAFVQVTVDGREASLQDLLPGQEVAVTATDGRVTSISRRTANQLPAYSQSVLELLVGRVWARQGDRLVLRLGDGSTRELALPAGVPVTRLGRPQSLADIKVGDLARVRLEDGRVVGLDLETSTYRVIGIVKGRLEEVRVAARQVVLAETATFDYGFWRPGPRLQVYQLRDTAAIYRGGRIVTPAELAGGARGAEVYLALVAPYGSPQVAQVRVKEGREVVFNSGVASYQAGTGVLATAGRGDPPLLLDQGSLVVLNGRQVDPGAMPDSGHVFVVAERQGETHRAAVVLGRDFVPPGARLVRGRLHSLGDGIVTIEDYSYVTGLTWDARASGPADLPYSTEITVQHWRDGQVPPGTFALGRYSGAYDHSYFIGVVQDGLLTTVSLWGGRQDIEPAKFSLARVAAREGDRLSLEMVKDWSEGYGRWVEGAYPLGPSPYLELDTGRALVLAGGRPAGADAVEAGDQVLVLHNLSRALMVVALEWY